MLDKKVLLDLVRLQHCLIDALQALRPGLIYSPRLAGLDIDHELHADGGRWHASRHGAGIAFTRLEPAPHLLVDMHKHVDRPDAIDAWRLQQFVESMGIGLSYDEAADLLAAALGNALLVREKTFLRFRC